MQGQAHQVAAENQSAARSLVSVLTLGLRQGEWQRHLLTQAGLSWAKRVMGQHP